MSAMITKPLAAAQTPAPAAPKRLTLAEFERDYGNRYAELIAGVPVLNEPSNPEYVMPGWKHGKVCVEIAYCVTHHVKQHDLGHVASHDSFVLVVADPPTVRGPDVAYAPYGKLPRGEVPETVPGELLDLVVEVRSPSDNWGAVFAKVGEYLGGGVRVVVVLDPATRTASVYRADALQEIVQADAELTLPDILPGFAVNVRKLFE